MLTWLKILCLLDFYVHFSEQRKGHGKAIIDYMLQNEHAEAYQVIHSAYECHSIVQISALQSGSNLQSLYSETVTPDPGVTVSK
ncbi:hypothetical protein NECAME_09016 [Necator americanus]|uniref:N-acetyltransferase domain-containing protein n=1 Tax=Necator americanus TaxID=51031 RepID=W2TGG6_NECAM|nr:hypothetical protein NECAME_09016 [Necator americanus]ETN80694.1 hypothetical protein NECAME_09016 [Necator americanus]